jgi:hypothetical protein
MIRPLSAPVTRAQWIRMATAPDEKLPADTGGEADVRGVQCWWTLGDSNS